MRSLVHHAARPFGRVRPSESRSFLVLAALAVAIWAVSTVAMAGF